MPTRRPIWRCAALLRHPALRGPREAVAQRLWELTHLSTAEHNRYAQGFGSRFSKETYTAFAKPENILIMVAGGSGLYSMVMPNWGGASHANSAVSVKVDVDQFCEVPGLLT